MAIKELVFSNKKWYEGKEPNYIGCTIQIPSHKAKIQLYSLANTGTRGFSGAGNEIGGMSLIIADNIGINDPNGLVWVNSINGKKIYGQMNKEDGDTYLQISVYFSGKFSNGYVSGTSGYFAVYIKLSDLIQNGGVILH